MLLDRKLMQDITIESAPAYLVLDALKLYKYSCLNEMIGFFILQTKGSYSDIHRGTGHL